ncbi:MAG: hypothetical protein JGK28_13775 [Microcoleus sp. PH2017_07_MST_O_A]|uniref:hypothetical protein n=1 Tax=Microcoleus sp. PH2017_08_TRC_O_A TaxID=2798819 RepID=UPI001D2C511C|nr:hypothetical protein [Microcoleus sp. PH2017_08_TRC_O_A]MCC3418993.1 hypothetical protein [Microcoleus sp. PH2017_07_MST_O_A]MCC3456929.1 hypothetical protein [Microcoleus sp. PH2017_08_TRC_O_A]MCC3510368.1 hypothetical protein [Microcoleus sp. PH2017_17_BER_D_A]
MKSSTRGGGFCLCSSGFQPPGFLGFSHFWIDGRSHFWIDGRWLTPRYATTFGEMCDRAIDLIPINL